ncbi:hypothetical protein V1477_007437, partial [Vespula maculifrons]
MVNRQEQCSQQEEERTALEGHAESGFAIDWSFRRARRSLRSIVMRDINSVRVIQYDGGPLVVCEMAMKRTARWSASESRVQARVSETSKTKRTVLSSANVHEEERIKFYLGGLLTMSGTLEWSLRMLADGGFKENSGSVTLVASDDSRST